MKTIKIITLDELEEKLLHTSFLEDELVHLTSEYEKLIPLKPKNADDLESKKANEWWDKRIELEDKYEDIILKKVYDYLLKNEEEGSLKNL